MKKLLALLLAVTLMLTCAAALGEGEQETTTAEALAGTWYLSQVINEGIAYNVNELAGQWIIEFAEDNTGTITATSEEEKNNIAWTEDSNGDIWFQEEGTQVPMLVKINENPTGEGNYLYIENDTTSYIFTREQNGLIVYAKTVKAEKVEDFDGNYAITYIAGDGYTMKVEDAMDDLAALGVTSTGVAVDTGMVELFGNDPRAYVFNEESGTLDMVIEDNIEFMNVHVFKTETGLAINWMDLTFYAEPVSE